MNGPLNAKELFLARLALLLSVATETAVVPEMKENLQASQIVAEVEPVRHLHLLKVLLLKVQWVVPG